MAGKGRHTTGTSGKRKSPPRRKGPLGRDGEIAASVHEVQNVLTSALGWLELARETSSPEAHARAFGVIGRSLVRARTLVAAIADPDERLRVAVRPFETASVLGEVFESLHPHCISRGVDLRLEPCEPGLVARGDADRVVQVLTNLTLNALDAVLAAGGNSHGAVVLGAAATGTHVGLVVKDGGTGMDAVTRERMFEPFFTTHAEAGAKRARGAGLGLAIVRELTDAMGGRLDVETTPGVGTSITLWLPREAAMAHAPPRDSAGLRPGTRVLVVDDEPAIRELLEVALTLRGAVVQAVPGLDQARALLVRGEVDVVLVDESLGARASGATLLKEVASAWPAVGRVLMTGAPTLDHIPPEACRHFVRKPFLLDDVVAELSRAFRKR